MADHRPVNGKECCSTGLAASRLAASRLAASCLAAPPCRSSLGSIEARQQEREHILQMMKQNFQKKKGTLVTPSGAKRERVRAQRDVHDHNAPERVAPGALVTPPPAPSGAKRERVRAQRDVQDHTAPERVVPGALVTPPAAPSGAERERVRAQRDVQDHTAPERDAERASARPPCSSSDTVGGLGGVGPITATQPSAARYYYNVCRTLGNWSSKVDVFCNSRKISFH